MVLLLYVFDLTIANGLPIAESESEVRIYPAITGDWIDRRGRKKRLADSFGLKIWWNLVILRDVRFLRHSPAGLSYSPARKSIDPSCLSQVSRKSFWNFAIYY